MAIVEWHVTDIDPFSNANTPEDLARLSQWAQAHSI